MVVYNVVWITLDQIDVIFQFRSEVVVQLVEQRREEEQRWTLLMSPGRFRTRQTWPILRVSGRRNIPDQNGTHHDESNCIFPLRNRSSHTPPHPVQRAPIEQR